jgi:hypothetical protein
MKNKEVVVTLNNHSKVTILPIYTTTNFIVHECINRNPKYKYSISILNNVVTQVVRLDNLRLAKRLSKLLNEKYKDDILLEPLKNKEREACIVLKYDVIDYLRANCKGHYGIGNNDYNRKW